VYPGAVRFLPPDDPLRQEWKEMFEHVITELPVGVTTVLADAKAAFADARKAEPSPQSPAVIKAAKKKMNAAQARFNAAQETVDGAKYLQSLSSHPAWARKTHEQAVEAGKQADALLQDSHAALKRQAQAGGYWGSDEAAAYNPKWNTVRCHRDCTAHDMTNISKDIWNLVGNSANMKWGDKAKIAERQLGRFGESRTLGSTAEKAPWHVGFERAVDLKAIDDQISSIQLYAGCVALVNPLTWGNSMKQKEHELWMSPLGIWLLQQLGLAQPQYDALASLILSVHAAIARVQHKSKMASRHLEACRALAKCDIRLPSMFCTVIHHRGVHWFDPVEGLFSDTGPAMATWTYNTEADGGATMKMVKSNKNKEESMMKNICHRERIQLARAREPDVYVVALRAEKGKVGSSLGSSDIAEVPLYLRKEGVITGMDAKSAVHTFTDREREQLKSFWQDNYPSKFNESHHIPTAGTRYEKLSLNGTTFRSNPSEAKVKTCNSIIKASYLDENDLTHWQYGILNYIVHVQVSVELQESYTLVHVEWFEDLDYENELSGYDLRRVSRQSRHPVLNAQPFTYFTSLEPINCILAPRLPNERDHFVMDLNKQYQ
jgi:hypothetical protein